MSKILEEKWKIVVVLEMLDQFQNGIHIHVQWKKLN